MTELGQILLSLINVIVAGVIVFFPSYTFLRSAKAVWEKAGSLDRFLMKREVCVCVFFFFCSVLVFVLMDRVQVFFEPDESIDVERVLTEYGAAAVSLVLLCRIVVGMTPNATRLVRQQTRRELYSLL